MIALKTQSVIVCTAVPNSANAGRSLGEQIVLEMAGAPPDALILFVSPKYDAAVFVENLERSSGAKLIVGCSSAGEFTSAMQGEGTACAVAIRSSELRFSAGMGRGISADREQAARDMVSNFRGIRNASHDYCAALVLTDALAGHADELIDHLTIATGGNYQFFGGGAGDDANFERTQVFCGREVSHDAAIALEIASPKPIGIGVGHGWTPATTPMRVTEVDGAVLKSLNTIPIVEIFRDHAAATGQHFDVVDPLPFFLHNILGIEMGDSYKLRVPLSLTADGSVVCAAEIPQGASVCIMRTDSESARDAASAATQSAVDQLQGHEPGVALFFDCVATRLRLGNNFGNELEALRSVLGKTQFAGCNTYGQVVRTEGQFNGFHNCTAVVCVLPA